MLPPGRRPAAPTRAGASTTRARTPRPHRRAARRAGAADRPCRAGNPPGARRPSASSGEICPRKLPPAPVWVTYCPGPSSKKSPQPRSSASPTATGISTPSPTSRRFGRQRSRSGRQPPASSSAPSHSSAAAGHASADEPKTATPPAAGQHQRHHPTLPQGEHEPEEEQREQRLLERTLREVRDRQVGDAGEHRRGGPQVPPRPAQRRQRGQGDQDGGRQQQAGEARRRPDSEAGVERGHDACGPVGVPGRT